MAFSESLKSKIKKKSDFRCCICEQNYVEIHHIIPQEENGPDSEDNAAPLCPSCHEIWGDNKSKRKYIREKRDYWYEVCEKKLLAITQPLQNYATKNDLEQLEERLNRQLLHQNKKSFPFENLFAKIFSIDTILKAKILIKNKNYDNALNILNNIPEKEPKKSESYYLLGYLYGERNDIENMIVSFEKANRIDNKFTSQITQTIHYYWAVNFNAGVNSFNEATKTIDQQKSLLLYNNSANSFNNAIKCKPESADSYLNLVYVYFCTKNLDKSLLALEKLMTISPSLDVIGMLGQAYNEKAAQLMDDYNAYKDVKNKTEALEFYNKSIMILEEGRKKYSDNNDLLLRLSNAYIGAHKSEKALYVFKIGVEKEPENKYYHYNYGVLLLNEKDYLSAEKQFMKAVELDSEYINAIYNLAVTYVRWGATIRDDMETRNESNDLYKEKFKTAIPYLEKYLSKEPKEFLIWELLGKVYANVGLMEKSNNAFDKAESIKNGDLI